MRHKYKRLDLHDRCMIEAYLTQGKQYAAIAALLSRNRSSIAREITHHSKPLSGYDASYAQHLSDQSRLVCRRKKRMDTVATANYVLYWLKQGRSPEGIAGRLRYEIEQGLQPCSIQISHETIYQ
jgi:IS30 family transposase